MKHLFLKTVCPTLAGFLLANLLQADIISWRNGGHGEYPGTTPPIHWDTQAGENVRWEVPLEDFSNGSPILVEGKLFFNSEPSSLICADSASGEILWTRTNNYTDILELSPEQIKEIEETSALEAEMSKVISQKNRLYRRALRKAEKKADPATEEKLEQQRKELEELKAERQALLDSSDSGQYTLPITHKTNGYSSYTPVSDGQYIFTSYGIGVTAAYDLAGNKQWAKILEHTQGPFGGSTSPLLVEDKVIVYFSDYVALDKKTGDEIWRAKSGNHYGTPATFDLEQQTFIVTPNGQIIRASDGKELVNDLVEKTASPYNCPVVKEGIVYFVQGKENIHGTASAFKIPETVEALEKEGLQQIWKTEIPKNRYYASPVIDNGIVYYVSRQYELGAIDADTGEIIYEQKLEGLQRTTAYPSLTSIGGNIYLGSDGGTTIVFKPGRTFEEIARNASAPYRSSPIAVDDILYYRTLNSMLALQKTE